MNEISLSNNLDQIEFEINFHKEKAGEAIWEIGRRLNHVKENDLAHGEFGNWLAKIEMTTNTANRFMRIARELPAHSPTLEKLGTTALDLIASLPEEEREKKHMLETGETKSVDEMTVRELQETKRKLREKEQEVQDLKNAEPEVVEKEVIKKVKPHDYEGLKSDNTQLEQVNRRLRNELDHIENRNKLIEKEYESLVQQQKEIEVDSEKYRQLNEEMKKMNNQLTDGQKKLKAQKEVYDLVRNANQLITEVAPLTYLIDTENILDNEYARKPIEKIISNLRDMADRLDTSINQQIYEGEIIND